MTTDEVHLQVIRQALARGNAAVMVGAGFSLNAENGTALKGWAALAQGLYGELHPGEKAPPLGTSDMLRLAEEYHRAFSRSKLDNFLREQLPDEKVSPGPLHRTLLKLNWSEIFTTNYDTLLERAADENVETPHYVVACREDIPESRVAKRRRIVKLHGSFPSQRPFIFTEEDYRLYPSTSAPFVNLVRQSMLENIFCLIGFSGDDPNFLQWIGWVRDMLETHTLPVYLFLDKAPTFGQERLLQSRHITPVVLPSIDAGSKGTFAERYAALFRRLKPTEKNTAASWPEESSSPLFPAENTPDNQAQYLEQILPLWRRNRQSYPGWLVAPFAVRERLHRQENGSPVEGLGGEKLHALLTERPLFGLIICSEYCWRQQTMLHPVWDQVAETAMQILQATFPYMETEGTWPSSTLPPSWKIDETSLSQAWLSLAIHVLRWCRQQMKVAVFETWVDNIRRVASRSQHILDSVTKEQIQLHLLCGEINLGLDLLEKWTPDPTEPYNNVLRAAWLAECGEISQALIAAHSALRGIRKLARLEPDSDFVLSREAWACQVTYILEQSSAAMTEVTNKDEEAELKVRLSSLGIRGHDPEREIDKLADLVNSEAHRRARNRVRTVGFDIGSSSAKIYFSNNNNWEKIRHCFAWWELTDSVGYLSKVRNFAWRVDIFKQAAWWIKDNESQERVHGLMVRLADNRLFDESEDELAPYLRWLNRDDVACLNIEFAQQACADAFRLAFTRGDGTTRSRQSNEDQVSFQLERFSRLVVRETRLDKLHHYTNELLRIYSDADFQKSEKMHTAYANAFNRTLDSLPQSLLEEFLPRILRLPARTSISVQQENNSADWPDWPRALWTRTIKPTASLKQLATECALDAAIHLEVESTRKSELANRIVFNRLLWLLKTRLLTQSAAQLVGNYLWLNPTMFPRYAGISPIELLRFKRQASDHKIFKQWYFAEGINSLPTGQLCETLHISSALGVSWNLREIATILSSLHSWWEKTKQEIKDYRETTEIVFFSDRQQRIDVEWFEACLALHVIPREDQLLRQLPELDEWIRDVMAVLEVSEYSCWRMKLAISQRESTVDKTFVQQLMRNVIDSGSRRIGKAIDVIESWILSKNYFNCPDVLIETMIASISPSNRSNLVQVIEFFTKTLEQKAGSLTAPQLMRLSVSIDALLHKLDYSKVHHSEIPRYDVPSIRYACARLAKHLSLIGVTSTEVDIWVSQLRADPLPEIRQLSEH